MISLLHVQDRYVLSELGSFSECVVVEQSATRALLIVAIRNSVGPLELSPRRVLAQIVLMQSLGMALTSSIKSASVPVLFLMSREP